MAPLVPAAIILAVYACGKLCSHPYYQRFAVAAAMIVALVGTLPSIDWKMAHIWAVNVPVLGWAIVTDGRGTIQQYEASGGFQSERLAQPIKRAEGKAWVYLSRTTALKLAQHGAARTRTAFGFLHYLYNTNTVGLEQLVNQGNWTAFAAIDPVDTKDTLAGDVNWLTHGSPADACLLVTAGGEKGHIHPLANQATMAEAAKQAGFETIDGWAMPDGQKVTLWRRNSQELHCADIAGIKHAEIPDDLMRYVTKKEMGDIYGTLKAYDKNTLFVHPGQTTTTQFEFDTDAYQRNHSQGLLRIDATMAPNISEDAIRRGGGTAKLTIVNANEPISVAVVKPSAPFQLQLAMSKCDHLTFIIGNNGVPDSNWLLLSIRQTE